MHIISETTSDGVVEQLFTLDGIPGALWRPEHATGPRPLILMGHGGGQHKLAPAMLSRAHRFVRGAGFAAAAVDVPNHGDRPLDPAFDRIATANRARMQAGEPVAALVAELHEIVARQTVPEWRAVLDALQEYGQVGAGPVGYWGVSMGCGLGVPFVAAEPRVRAAVLGLGPLPRAREVAARITVPVQFLVQWDDERIPRELSLALFEALGSTEKTLHASPGGHAQLPEFEVDDALRFFARHLGAPRG